MISTRQSHYLPPKDDHGGQRKFCNIIMQEVTISIFLAMSAQIQHWWFLTESITVHGKGFWTLRWKVPSRLGEWVNWGNLKKGEENYCLYLHKRGDKISTHRDHGKPKFNGWKDEIVFLIRSFIYYFVCSFITLSSKKYLLNILFVSDIVLQKQKNKTWVLLARGLTLW